MVILEDIPQVVQYEFYPEEKEDAAQSQQFALTWADGEVSKQFNLKYNSWWVPAPEATDNSFLNLKKAILLTEPEVIMVAGAQGKMAPMACAFMLVQDIQGKGNSRILKVLFNTGGSSSMVSVGNLPPDATVTLAPVKMVNTLAGTMTTEGIITLKGMRLPEFNHDRVIEEHKLQKCSAPCKYDIILGVDFLKKMGIKLDYKKI